MNRFLDIRPAFDDIPRNPGITNPANHLRTDAQRASIESIVNLKNGQLYSMEYTADYKLDQILAAGITDIPHLVEFVNRELLDDGNAEAGSNNGGCSAFTASTRSGEMIYGRNFDYLMNMTAVLVRTRPENGYASIGLADAGWIGYLAGSLDDGVTDLSPAVLFPYLLMDGMNEKGLVISVLKLEGPPTRQNTGKQNISTTVAIRLVLDRAANVDEAIELFKGYDMQASSNTSSFHFLVADASGRAVVLEYCHDVFSVVEEHYVTNFYLDPSMDGYGHGVERYRILQSVLEFKKEALTEGEAMSLLQLVSQEKTEESTSFTQWSTVYNLSKLTGTASVLRDYDHLFTFSLDKPLT
ncbi:linear amide C-N hydrolase [Gracilibacillus sp. Marseille-QA3620]